MITFCTSSQLSFYYHILIIDSSEGAIVCPANFYSELLLGDFCYIVILDYFARLHFLEIGRFLAHTL